MPDWADRRVGVMAYGLYHKFVMHADLRLMLIDTGIEELVEGNYWHDNFWGDCGCPKCASIKGKNVLGRLLMNTRNYFRELTSIVLE